MSVAIGYFMQMSEIMLLVLPAWAVLRCVYLLLAKKRFRWKHELLMLGMMLWSAGVISQTVIPFSGPFAALPEDWSQSLPMRLNLVPFKTIIEYFQCDNIRLFVLNFLGNVFIFVPLGFFPPLLHSRWKGWRGALFPALCSLGVETAQIFTGRSVDVDDLILNALGGALGWLVARGVLYFREKRRCQNKAV